MSYHSSNAHSNLIDMIIYKITNKITGKSYIGQTVQSIQKRWIMHYSKGSTCRYLSNAIKKYGKENFNIKVLARSNSIEEMNHREQYYIKIFNTLSPNGYNLMTGGGNSRPSPDVTKRRSESLKNFYANNVPKPISLETRAKISKAGKGRKKSQKSIDATALAHSISVFQYDLSGNFIAEYRSARDAMRVSNIGNEDIGKACKSERRSAGGFQWRYFKLDNIGKIRNKKPMPKRGPGNSPNARPVAKVDIDGNILQVYKTATEAAINNGCDISTVLKVCKGIFKNTKGLLFIFFKNLG